MHIRCVLLYLESMGNPRNFVPICPAREPEERRSSP